MNNETLTRLTCDISEQFFRKPFEHKALFNKRLRTTGGRYMLSSHNIEVNPKHYECFGMEELILIIKHELCHYHLHLEGRGYRHSDKEFKNLLQQVGGARHCQTLPMPKTKNRKAHYYECLSCYTLYKRYRKMDTGKYVCGKCKGYLKKINKVIDH